MKIIFKIARAEIRHLFYSPIAWITLLLFFGMASSQLMLPLVENSRAQDILIANSPAWEGFPGPLTYKALIAALTTVISYVFLFVPLITMSTINRENQAGTMNLLSSSPVGVREIVLGKYLGLQCFNLILLCVPAIFLFTGYFVIEHAEFNWYLSMLLGVFLFTACYMAIGMYISSLTNYPLVAAIITFLVLFILQGMSTVWQQYDFFRDITFFLSIEGRLETMLAGLITTRDLSYYLLIISMFVGLTMIRLKSRQITHNKKLTVFRTLAFVLVIITIGYFTNRPGNVGYLDVTRDQRNTLDSASRSVFAEMDGSRLTVTLYTNLLGDGLVFGVPSARNRYIWGIWEFYRRFYPNIEFKYVNYYDEKPVATPASNEPKSIHERAALIARLAKVDTADFLKPGEVHKLIDLSKEDEWKVLMELEYKGKKSICRIFERTDKILAMTGSIRRLTRETTPVLAFTTGHYERSPWMNGMRDYGSHTNKQKAGESLISVGVDADTFSLRQPVPDSAAVLVVADPRTAMAPEEIDHFKSYIDKGGNALIYGEPGKQHIINPLLQHIGITLEDGELVFPAQHRAVNDFFMMLRPAFHDIAREPGMQVYMKNKKGLVISFLSGVASIDYKAVNGFTVEPMVDIVKPKGTWIEKGFFRTDSAAPVFSAAEGDIRRDSYVVAVRLTRKINNREQRIIVVGDADFMSAGFNDGSGFGLGFYSWLLYNDYPVYKPVVLSKDRRLSITHPQAKKLAFVYNYIIPAVILLTGLVLLIRRKRK